MTPQGQFTVSSDNELSFALIIPTRNPGGHVERLLSALQSQMIKPDQIIVIDSESTDGSPEKFRQHGIIVHAIPAATFNHGGTRQQALSLVEADIYVFLTQDAIPANEYTFAEIIRCFVENPSVGAAYGRQLPHWDANHLAAHAREFNYPACSQAKSFDDRKTLGVKTCFASNSFAAYRKKALDQVDGFPLHVIGSEDTYVFAKMLVRGWYSQYVASAQVLHSHNYSMLEEFKRYFDIGSFWGENDWIEDAFGAAEGEGLRFMKSELRYLLEKHAPHLIPVSVVRNVSKYVGYKLGRRSRLIPKKIKLRISMFPAYWANI